MEEKLNEVERDFIEFVAERRKRPSREIEQIFIKTKQQFTFSERKYRKLGSDIHKFYRIMYDAATEEDSIEAYRFHSLLHLFRFISYTYPKSKSVLFHELIRSIKRKQWGNIYNYFRRKVIGKRGKGSRDGTGATATFLVEEVPSPLRIVDYGCGLGYISFEMAKANSETKVYLLDVDCLTLDFAEYRFRKHGIDVETIPVSKDELYPKLPKHNICIATEVMEHLNNPLTAYENIYHSMEVGGVLYGNFEDHKGGMFHVSPDLSTLRKRTEKDFEKIGFRCYRKK